MKPMSKILGLLSAVVFLATCAYSATITGTVKGPDGTPVRAAFVHARNAKTRITVIVLSDGSGRYKVDSLPAGDY
jgi:hypothetical protein